MKIFRKIQIRHFIPLALALILFACSPVSQAPSPSAPTSAPIDTLTPIIPTQTLFPTPDSSNIPKYHRYEVQNISISPDGKLLALSTIYDMQVYDLSTGELLYTYEYEPESQHNSHAYTRITSSPNGEYLAIGQLNEGVRIWKVSPWELVTAKVETGFSPAYLWTHPGIEWSPAGDKLVLGFITRYKPAEEILPGEVLLWDKNTNTWEQIYAGEFTNVTWMPDDQITLMLLDERLVSISPDDKTATIENEGFYYSLIWSPDKQYFCRYFLMGGGVYRHNQGGIEATGIDCLPPLAWSPDSQYLASRTSNNEISIWNISKGTKDVIQLESDDIYALAWSLQGELYAIGEMDKRNYIWNATQSVIVLEIE